MSARSVTATLINKTNQSLTLIGSKLVHGTWSENQTPPSEIPAGGQGNWMAESNGFATGVEGTVTYLAGNVGQAACYFDNPYVGSNSYSGSAPNGFVITVVGSGGDNSTVTYTLTNA